MFQSDEKNSTNSATCPHCGKPLNVSRSLALRPLPVCGLRHRVARGRALNAAEAFRGWEGAANSR